MCWNLDPSFDASILENNACNTAGLSQSVNAFEVSSEPAETLLDSDTSSSNEGEIEMCIL
jgi:hypothetical protein